MKKFWSIIGILFVISMISVVVKLVFFPANVANHVIDTANGVVDKTMNADNALYNYEHFKDDFNNAKSQIENIKQAQKDLDNLKATYGDPSTWTKDIRDQQAHYQQNLDGYTMMYESIVKEYNADSQKANRNIFKDKNLPDQLPTDYTQFPNQ